MVSGAGRYFCPEATQVVIKMAVAAGVDLQRFVGERVVVEGTVAEIPMQHLVADYPSHPHMFYFEIGDQQIVVYGREEGPRSGRLRIEGTVVELIGGGKRAVDRDFDEPHREYHIQADRWESLE